MKIFDLTKKYDFTNDLQDNLKLLHKIFGSNFNIKFNKIKVYFFK